MMGCRSTAQAALILLGCCLVSAVVSGDSTWSLVASGAIRVVTDDSPATATAVLEELVLAQSMLRQIASADAQLQLHVFALKDRKSLSEFAPQRLKRGDIHTFGFSHTGPHAAFIALRTDRPAAARVETLRHEYAHVLTAALSPDAPAWLDEGLAEFWSSIVVEGGRLVVGRPVARHLEFLRKRKWLPLESMLSQRRGSLPSRPDHIELFYAQAWAMVHYLMLGPDANGFPGFIPSTSPLPGQSDSLIQQYVVAGAFREASVPWSPPADSRAIASTLPEARALAERAYLLASGEQPGSALAVARRALALSPNEPLALEVIGTYHFLNNQPEQAREWLTRALAAGSRTYAVALYLSLLSTTPAERERYLTMAVRGNPDSGVVWQRLVTIFEEDGRLEIARRWCRQWSRQPLLAFFTAYTPACDFRGRQ